MNILQTTIKTTVDREREEIRLKVLGEYQAQVMSLKDKATREALISMGWTPPWNYNMEEAPKDGSVFLARDVHEYTNKLWIYECVWNGFEWYHGLGDNWKSPSPVAWKPILE